MKLPEQKLAPFMLPPGTLVGPWKVKAYAGGGAYGLVFWAVKAGNEQAGDVALKVACYPGDERFQREVVLLSRVDHPSVPRLLDHGEWQPPRGEAHPFIVMEWVEGLALYAWAEWSNASSSQVLRVLGQLAGALVATHAAGGVHRDVKGGNIRVSLDGARAVLMDFGAGTYAGAAPLTKGALPPGTDDYRSPEALEYVLQRPRGSTETYAAQPTDDVFALGVCAYRLVTGWYLPPLEVRPEEQGPWRMEWKGPRPPAEMNPRVAPELSELILRMLTRERGARPSAAQLAEALEEAVRKAGADADRPLFPSQQPVAAVESAAPLRGQAGGGEGRSAAVVRSSSRARRRTWIAYAACALFGAVLSAVAVGWGLRPGQEGRGAVAPPAPGQEPVGLGDTSLKAPTANAKDTSGLGPASRPVPQTPLDDQRREPHCYPPAEVTIHGGCWVEVPSVKPPCKEPFYEWQGSCYVPSLIRRRKPTSDPQ
ncbi:MAG TPA: serine/threonine-protein kinase [Hyalangium sp.]|nr:serine/threonine-protein kinase [Hyalangium sp.]